MNNNYSTLLPFIMELITRRPNLVSTTEELTEGVKDAVLEEHIRPFGSLDQAIKFALEVGSNLGILSLTDEVVPVPFNFRRKKPATGPGITAAQGRQFIKKALAKAKSKAKACAGKRPWKRVAGGGKQRLSYKVARTGTFKLVKSKQKKRA